MMRGLPGLLLVLFGVVMIGLIAVVSDPQKAQLARRNAQRQQDVAEILGRVEEFAKENHTLPPLTVELQQIGTEQTGCGLETPSCTIRSDACINLHSLMNNRDLSLPSDLRIGSYYKTGYGISFDPSTQIVKVVACGAEDTAQISLERSLQKYLTEVEVTATKNAKK